MNPAERIEALVRGLCTAEGEHAAARLVVEHVVSVLGAPWAISARAAGASWEALAAAGPAPDGVLARVPAPPAEAGRPDGPSGARAVRRLEEGHRVSWFPRSGSALVWGDGPAVDEEVRAAGTVGCFALAALSERRGAAEERDLHRRLLRHVPAMMVITRGPAHLVEWSSLGADERTAPVAPRLVGVPLFEALADFGEQGFRQLADRVYRSAERWVGVEVPVRARRPEGVEESWYNMLFEPLTDESGRVEGLFLFALDVGEGVRGRAAIAAADRERVRLRESLARAQRLDTVGRLASRVSHDLNNIVGVILGNAQLLAELVPPGHAARARVDAIVAACGRARDFAGGLQQVAGGGEPTLVETDLCRRVEELGVVAAASRPSGVTVRTRVPPAPLLVPVEPGRLDQAVLQLVRNAFEALGERPGLVELTLERRTLTDDDVVSFLGAPLVAGDYAVVEVRDDGPGLGAEQLARVFEPFFSTRGKGRGLGLAGVLGATRRMRGGVAASSEAGAGARFTVVLPVGGAARTAATVTPAPPPALPVAAERAAPGRRLLVVEHDARDRALLTRALRTDGREVDGAESLAGVGAGAAPEGVFLHVPALDLGARRLVEEALQRWPGVGVVLCAQVPDGVGRAFVGAWPGVRFARTPHDLGTLRRLADELLAGAPAAGGA